MESITVMAPRRVFVSHETYTPARGGSAGGDQALRAARRRGQPSWSRQHQGITGHLMGVGIEDVAAEGRCRRHRPAGPQPSRARPVLGTTLSRQAGRSLRLRLAAGFGPREISMVLLRGPRAGPRSGSLVTSSATEYRIVHRAGAYGRGG